MMWELFLLFIIFVGIGEHFFPLALMAFLPFFIGLHLPAYFFQLFPYERPLFRVNVQRMLIKPFRICYELLPEKCKVTKEFFEDLNLSGIIIIGTVIINKEKITLLPGHFEKASPALRCIDIEV